MVIGIGWEEEHLTNTMLCKPVDDQLFFLLAPQTPLQRVPSGMGLLSVKWVGYTRVTIGLRLGLAKEVWIGNMYVTTASVRARLAI